MREEGSGTRKEAEKQLKKMLRQLRIRKRSRDLLKVVLALQLFQDLRPQMRSRQEKFWNSRFHRMAAVET